MLISKDLAKAFNEQIGHEFGASLQYVSIAAHFEQRNLKLLAKLFFEGCTILGPALRTPPPVIGSARIEFVVNTRHAGLLVAQERGAAAVVPVEDWWRRQSISGAKPS